MISRKGLLGAFLLVAACAAYAQRQKQEPRKIEPRKTAESASKSGAAQPREIDRLRADLRRLQAENAAQAKQIEGLRAEVRRLQEENQRLKRGAPRGGEENSGSAKPGAAPAAERRWTIGEIAIATKTDLAKMEGAKLFATGLWVDSVSPSKDQPGRYNVRLREMPWLSTDADGKTRNTHFSCLFQVDEALALHLSELSKPYMGNGGVRMTIIGVIQQISIKIGTDPGERHWKQIEVELVNVEGL